jgi:hypothetical protein
MLFKKSQAQNHGTQEPKSKETRSKSKAMRYYDQFGALQAYANRAMALAFLCVPTTLLAVALAAYVRLQPPTVIRVNESGEALPFSQKPTLATTQVDVAQGANAGPNDFEKRGFLRLFLSRYLNFSPDSVSRNWADALNMMTANLRRSTLNAMEKDNTVGKVQDEQITSVFHLREIDPSKDDPLTFTAFGAKEIHRVSDHRETTTSLVGKFHIRLISERRTEQNPSGLLIAEYSEDLIDGREQAAQAQTVTLGDPH